MDDRAPVPKLSWIDRLRERPRYLAACIAGGLVFVIGLVVALMSLTRAPSTAGAIESPSLHPTHHHSVAASPSAAPSFDMHDMHDPTPQPSQSIVTLNFRLTVLGPVSEGDGFVLER